MEQICIKPEYFKEFKCIGGACEDTCCKGWSITVDDKTYKKYKCIQDFETRKKILKNIGKSKNQHAGDVRKMRLIDGKCGFLDSKGLCEIHSLLGEEHLSQTCKKYPRNYYVVDGVWEQSLTLSCPEAARIVLDRKEKMAFEQVKEDMLDKEAVSINLSSANVQEWQKFLWDMRILAIEILQNRDLTIKERLFALGVFIRDIDHKVMSGQEDQIPTLVDTHRDRSNNLDYKGVLREIKGTTHTSILLSERLIKACEKQFINTYNTLFENFYNMINKDYKNQEEGYNQLADMYDMQIEQEYGYMIENYMVNEVFQSLFPISSDTPWNGYMKLIIHYVLVKVILMSYLEVHKGRITKLEIIKTIQVVCKVYGHDATYEKYLQEYLKSERLNTLAAMAALIKC